VEGYSNTIERLEGVVARMDVENREYISENLRLRTALVRIARGEESGFELQQVAIRALADMDA
jgi:hypothetical protein